MRALVFLNNRYHDPTLGTFISVDPLVAATGEPYIYASGNPTTLSDPSGLCATSYIEELGCSGTRKLASVGNWVKELGKVAHLLIQIDYIRNRRGQAVTNEYFYAVPSPTGNGDRGFVDIVNFTTQEFWEISSHLRTDQLSDVVTRRVRAIIDGGLPGDLHAGLEPVRGAIPAKVIPLTLRYENTGPGMLQYSLKWDGRRPDLKGLLEAAAILRVERDLLANPDAFTSVPPGTSGGLALPHFPDIHVLPPAPAQGWNIAATFAGAATLFYLAWDALR